MLYDLCMKKGDVVPDGALSFGSEYYQEICKSSPIGIELFDEKGLLLHANPACLRIFGIDKVEDILGFKLFDDPNLPLDSRERLKKGETVRLVEKFDFDLVRRKGLYPTSKSGIIYLDGLVTAFKEEGGRIRGYFAQIQDVTEQRHAQELLIEYQHQLERTIDARTDQLKKVNARLKRELQERQRMMTTAQSQRALADALRDTAMAVTSSLELDEVLYGILSHIGQVVPYDAVILLLIENGNIRNIRYRGLADEEASAFIHDDVTPLQDYPNLALALARKEAILIPSTKDNADWVMNEETSWIASNITTPIIYHNAVIGFINLYSKEAGFFTGEHIQPLTLFASQAAIAIGNARLYERMQRMAIVDELTGLYNRRGLYELGIREVSRVQRFKRPLTALFFDIDYFKQFNDRYSYAVGDQVLRFLSEHLRFGLRDVDLLVRYGGEEFVALLPEISLDEGAEIAERLRADVERLRMSVGEADLHITVSIGVAPLTARPHHTDILAGRERELLDILVEKAGEKLHEAKNSGRNRIAF